jgi:hypothetical protein
LDRADKNTSAPHRRPLAVSLAAIAITIAAGVTVRFVHLGLPAPVVKYGGSGLWAVMIYWLCSTLMPSWPLRWSVVLSGTLGSAVELLKLYNPPWLDAFRGTLPGIILLGRIFSVRDIVTYWIAITLAAGVDHVIRRRTPAAVLTGN